MRLRPGTAGLLRRHDPMDLAPLVFNRIIIVRRARLYREGLAPAAEVDHLWWLARRHRHRRASLLNNNADVVFLILRCPAHGATRDDHICAYGKKLSHFQWPTNGKYAHARRPECRICSGA